jgi:hypothetical protein
MKTLTMLSLLLTVAAMAAAAESSATTQDANTSGVPVPPVPEFTKESPEAYGLALAQYMDVYDTGWKDQYSTSRMTLFDARGDSVQRRVVQLVLEGVDGDKSIVKFQSPAEIKGVAALTHEHPDTRTRRTTTGSTCRPAGASDAFPAPTRRQVFRAPSLPTRICRTSSFASTIGSFSRKPTWRPTLAPSPSTDWKLDRTTATLAIHASWFTSIASTGVSIESTSSTSRKGY